MPLGLPQKAKRALVSLLLFLARQYGVHIDVTRDSSDKSVETACRKVARRVHPDKGGDLADMQRLQRAGLQHGECSAGVHLWNFASPAGHTFT